MKTALDFLRFRKLIAPYALELLFWAGIAGTLYGSYWLFTHDNWAWWVALVFGTLLARLIFEFALLAFRSYERLVEIRDALMAGQPENPGSAKPSTAGSTLN